MVVAQDMWWWQNRICGGGSRGCVVVVAQDMWWWQNRICGGCSEGYDPYLAEFGNKLDQAVCDHFKVSEILNRRLFSLRYFTQLVVSVHSFSFIYRHFFFLDVL